MQKTPGIRTISFRQDLQSCIFWGLLSSIFLLGFCLFARSLNGVCQRTQKWCFLRELFISTIMGSFFPFFYAPRKYSFPFFTAFFGCSRVELYFNVLALLFFISLFVLRLFFFFPVRYALFILESMKMILTKEMMLSSSLLNYTEFNGSTIRVEIRTARRGVNFKRR